MRSRIPLLVALALTGCGSELDKPSGPEPPIVDGATTLAFADSALQVAVDEAVASSSGALVALSASGRGIADLGGIEQPGEIFAIELASGDVRLLSNSDLSVGSPAWSPDGAWIAYIEADAQDEFSHVWVMDADGNEARQLTFGEFWERTLTWSLDGTHIAVGRMVDMETRYDIYIVPLEGGAEERVTDDPYDDMYPSWGSF